MDYQGQKKYDPKRNCNTLNIHKIVVFIMWHANVDFQPMVSQLVALKYIATYASKIENSYENDQNMLSRISNFIDFKDFALYAYTRFLVETLVVDYDIRAQAMCHKLDERFFTNSQRMAYNF